MKIALYYPWIYLKSGIEKTILALIKGSTHQWTVFTSHFDRDATYPEFQDIEVIELKKVSVKRSYLDVLWAAVTIFNQKIDMESYDALFVHSEGLGDLITFRNHQKPVICYCWTPLKIIHDPMARREYLKNNKFKISVFLLAAYFFKIIDKFAWRHYKYIYCCSNEVKNRILKAGLARSSNQIEVVYPGVDIKNINPIAVYEPYFLHPARLKWWKNIELSITSFKDFQNRYPDFNNFRLVVAGQVDEGSKSYYNKLLNMSKGYSAIQIIANPSANELVQLYKNCYAVLNTTLNEDWGLVPLEGMAYGKPIIAVNQGGPKESIIDKKTGILAEPTTSCFMQAMKILVEDKSLVLKMGAQARKHSLEYDCSYFIKKIDNYFECLCKKA